jgi:ATP-dependent helicase/nuclease subunit B
MPAETTVIVGPARSGKSATILTFYCRALLEQPPGSTLWIAPNRAAVSELREQITKTVPRAVLWPGCFTFADFAETVLHAAEVPIRPVDRLLKRQLLKQLVSEQLEQNHLPYFAGIAQSEGFLLWLDQFIGDLKRQEIWPDDFKKSISHFGRRSKDQELGLLYDEYQRLLNEYHCYDLEGQFWTALDHLKRDQWGPFANVTQVVIDGFSDFTFTQHEILQLLAQRSSRMWITLPGEPSSDEREDLFRKPRATLAELQRRLHPQVHEVARPTKPEWPALTHIEQRLFGNPRLTTAAPNTTSIEIWPCEHELGELRRIAREIKHLLVHGDPAGSVIPERIGVVFRSLSSVAPLVREVFAEYGLPFSLGEGIPLGEAPLLITLLKLLDLIQNDWPYRLLLDLIGNGYLRFADDEEENWQRRAACEYAIRSLQIPEGQHNLFYALSLQIDFYRKLVQDAERSGEERPDIEPLLERLELAHQALQQFAQIVNQLPSQATWTTWIGLLQQFAKQLGLLQLQPANDEILWRQMLAGLNTARTWERWQNAPPRTVPRQELIDELLMIGQTTQQQSADRQRAGCVRVLGARQARTGEFTYLFLAGLTERSFPQLGGDDRLYSAIETRSLNQVGFRFTERADRVSDEMLLFYEVITRPTRRLVLSYPALDDKAEALTPSPFLDEVRRACGATPIAMLTELNLRPVLPTEQTLWSPREQRLRAIDQALQGSTSELAAFVNHSPRHAQGLLSSLQSIAGRAEHKVYGHYDGIFASDRARTHLSKDFGRDHCWSTSQLEQYAACPFKFFANRILRLRELPELSFGTDNAARGSWFHAAVTWLHRQQLLTRGCIQSYHQAPEEFAEVVHQALSATRKPPQYTDSFAAILYELDQQALSQLFTGYLEQTNSYHTESTLPFEPSHFEVAFGPSRSDDRIDALCQSQPWTMQVAGETLKIAGQVDRIDLAAVKDRAVFSIIDYKTGKQPAFKDQDFDTGLRLQLPLYALAAEQFLLQQMGAIAWQIGYWSVKEQKVKPYVLSELIEGEIRPTETWRIEREKLQRRVLSLVRGIQRGEFPMHNLDQHCTTHCEYRTICRIGQARSLEKEWSLPEITESSDN